MKRGDDVFYRYLLLVIGGVTTIPLTRKIYNLEIPRNEGTVETW